MEFSLEVVSIHQIVEPAPNMKVLLVWQNIDQICFILPDHHILYITQLCRSDIMVLKLYRCFH